MAVNILETFEEIFANEKVEDTRHISTQWNFPIHP